MSSLKTLREVREGRFTQMEISALTGYGQTLVSSVERGKRNLTSDVARRLADILGVAWLPLQIGHIVASAEKRLSVERSDSLSPPEDAEKARERMKWHEKRIEEIAGVARELERIIHEQHLTPRETSLVYGARMEVVEWILREQKARWKLVESLEALGAESHPDRQSWREEVARAYEAIPREEMLPGFEDTGGQAPDDEETESRGSRAG